MISSKVLELLLADQTTNLLWLNQAWVALEKKTTISISGCSCRNRTGTVQVYLVHDSRFLLPIYRTVLNDTEIVYPEISISKLLYNVHCILNRFGEFDKWDEASHICQVTPFKGFLHYSTPAMG